MDQKIGVIQKPNCRTIATTGPTSFRKTTKAEVSQDSPRSKTITENR